MNPKTEEWGAHASRVQFSASTRKTMSALTITSLPKFIVLKSAQAPERGALLRTEPPINTRSNAPRFANRRASQFQLI